MGIYNYSPFAQTFMSTPTVIICDIETRLRITFTESSKGPLILGTAAATKAFPHRPSTGASWITASICRAGFRTVIEYVLSARVLTTPLDRRFQSAVEREVEDRF